MDRVVPVVFENAESVASEIVAMLKGKTFSATTFHQDLPSGQATPKVITGLRLYDGVLPTQFNNSKGYVVEGGKTIILLSPRRKIFWDLIVEKVAVTFLEDGNIVIQRVLPNDATLWRVLILL